MSFFIPVVLTLLLSMSVLAVAQEFDCNCSPAEYTFQLRYSNSCLPDSGFGPGVSGIGCSGTNLGQGMIVTFAQLGFFDPAGGVISAQTFTDLNLVDGDTLPIFTSPSTTLVGSIELHLQGEATNGVEFENQIRIFFTNECGVLALQEGTELGWVVFVSLFVLISNDVHFFGK